MPVKECQTCPGNCQESESKEEGRRKRHGKKKMEGGIEQEERKRNYSTL